MADVQEYNRLMANGRNSTPLVDIRYRYGDSTNAAINNPKFASDVAIKVQKELGRGLMKQELDYIVHHIARYDAGILNRYKKADLCDLIAKTIMTRFREFACKPSYEYDIQEVLKAIMAEQGGANESAYSFGEQRSPFSEVDTATSGRPKAQIDPKLEFMQHKSVIFDSRYRYESFDTFTQMKWDVTNNVSEEDGASSIIGSMRNIVMMRVYPIILPYSLATYPDSRVVSLELIELSAQSFVAHEKRRYHFTFNVTTNSNKVFLSPDNQNDGYYKFGSPVSKIDSITMVFGNPLQLISFDPDRAYYAMTYGALTTLITTEIDHNLSTGDTVIFTNFTTSAPILDAETIAIINRPSGHYITFVAPNQFTIPINTFALAPVVGGTKFVVFYNSKRIFINIEFTYMIGEP